MNEENNLEQPQETLGQALKKRREEAGMSLEQLASALKLSVLQLQRLENDEHELLGPITFVRGYIKSYCRELKIDTQAILALLPEQVEPAKKSKMQSFSRRTEKEANDNRLMLFSYFILAVIIGSSVFWWWQNSSPALEEQTATVMPSQLEISELTPATEQLSSETEQLNAQPATSSVPPESENAQPATNNTNVVEAKKPIEEQSNLDPEHSTVVMHFNEDSWVEIHDGNGDRIAFGVKKAGYVMTVTGPQPFNVVLGKHQVVDITFQGEAVDTSHFAKNRLAKFTLPLSE
ncbi:RodZ domain-containing protein [uncultured Pseudoalteromonas sp.]|uniref:RodZ domain-containing protein n=1 Tax=uncultured Pseudoalteromonas sp. TaxID=114053 RepID=UPI0025D83054|nr:RodZ domain-containing protein [uncultured Pseudoalteromonas sp.]|tara:strand:+ start:8353 stop:9225 length:873 start_codon:yes stop_codon:yes gene_type:complete